MRIGEIISRINDAVKIRAFINEVSINLVVNSLILFFSVITMFVFSWKLTLVVLTSVPLFAFIYYLFNKINKKYQRKIMETSADLESQLVESLTSISTIKKFNAEDFANRTTEARFSKLLNNAFTSTKSAIIATNSIDLVSSIIVVAVLWVGSFLVVKQEISLGSLMVFFSLTGTILPPIGILISSNKAIQDALIASDRLFQIMDLETEEDENHKLIIDKKEIGDITFDNVSFRYGSKKLLFNSLCLKIKKNQMTAIVGESGSGKTSLISLLQNLYPIQSGHIYIGSYDITMVTKSSLRNLIGIVPQKIELLSGTILSNIAFGDLNPDIKKVLKIIKELGLKDFIDGLPYGVETIIGEQGATLSGGERQRIAIARALYKDPDILIFDEATSSIDSFSEKQITSTLNKLAQRGKTIIIIAHRINTIKGADNIIVLENGKVVESGNHLSLLENHEKYWALWSHQTQ